jgi:hypothetical protein
MATTADGTGKITGHFTIPSNIPIGTKLVEFVGQGGTKAQASFTGRGQITVTELRQVQNVTTVITSNFERYDPIAETFTPTSNILVSSVDVWPTAKGSSGNTIVEIRECENGVPTQTVVVSEVKKTNSLLLNQWQRFSWAPVRLQRGREYAIVVGCDDAVTKMATAELGKFDSSAQKHVTVQPYQIGVLLSSSNGSSWSVHQEKDLTFRLMATPMASTTSTVALPNVNLTNADEIMVLAGVERPSPECDVVFQITLPLGGGITADNRVVTVAEGERVLLPVQVTGTLQWVAILTGTADFTPRLHKDVQMAWGTRAPTGTYITRSMPAGAGSKVSVYFEALVPGTSSLTIEVANTPTGTFVPVAFVSGTAIGDGWIDYTYRNSSYANTNAVVRVTMTGDARNRPMIRKFRVVVS